MGPAGSASVAAAALLCVLAGPAVGQADLIKRGGDIVEAQCSRCHATKRTGASPRANALPFRDISKRYPLHYLEEALAEEIVTGHNDMPAFQFEPDEIDAILSYIRSISDPAPAKSR